MGIDSFDQRFLSTAIFASVFGSFALYHALFFIVLRKKLILYYAIFLIGLTCHWSLYFFASLPQTNKLSILAQNISLSTASVTILGLLLFSKEFLNINNSLNWRWNRVYLIFQWLIPSIMLLHIVNKIFFNHLGLNNFLLIGAAMMSLCVVALNLVSALSLSVRYKLPRLYLLANLPLLLAAIIYTVTWLQLRNNPGLDVTVHVYLSSALVTLQLIFFSLIIGFKYRIIETKNITLKTRHNETLKKEVERQTRELKEANLLAEKKNAELAKINEIKNQMFSLLTHDIRSPLSQFQSLLSVLKTDMDVNVRNNLIDRVYEELSEKIELINRLLHWSYSQLEGIEVDKELCDFQEIYEIVNLELNQLIESKQIDLQVYVQQKEVLIDKNMLLVILRNLLTNAFKFSSNQGLVKLWIKKEADMVEIGVQDFGVGMETSWLEKSESVKLPLQKSGTQGEKGTGFGLMIVRDFVKLNDGVLLCESVLGEGTVFRLLFPLEAS